MPGWKKESDYRNIVGEDFQLRFFKDAKENNPYTLDETNYRKEIYLPFKYNAQTGILGIQLKESDFDFYYNTNGDPDLMKDSKYTFVLVCYGKPLRKIGYFFIDCKVRNIKNSKKELINTQRTFRAFATNGKFQSSYREYMDRLRYNSSIFRPIQEDPGYVPAIFDAQERRKDIKSFYLVSRRRVNLLDLEETGYLPDKKLLNRFGGSIEAFGVEGTTLIYYQETNTDGFRPKPIEIFITSIWDEFTVPLEDIEVSLWDLIPYDNNPFFITRGININNKTQTCIIICCFCFT
jgi:hypothetical protein